MPARAPHLPASAGTASCGCGRTPRASPFMAVRTTRRACWGAACAQWSRTLGSCCWPPGTSTSSPASTGREHEEWVVEDRNLGYACKEVCRRRGRLLRATPATRVPPQVPHQRAACSGHRPALLQGRDRVRCDQPELLRCVPAADICAALDACLCCAHRNQAAACSAAGAALVRHCGQGSLSPCRLPGVDLPCPALQPSTTSWGMSRW